MAKILLVDDEKHILEAYSEELSDDVHQVVSIGSADNLLRKIILNNPDLVVLDSRLVEWDGQFSSTSSEKMYAPYSLNQKV